MKTKLAGFVILIFTAIACSNKNETTGSLSPIENISYLFDLFIEERYTKIISNDSLFKEYNLELPKDSLVNEGIFYTHILNQCIEKKYGNYIIITNEKLFNKFISKHQNNIILDPNFQFIYQKNKTEKLLFLVNKQNFLSLDIVANFDKKNNDSLVYQLKNEEMLKKYEAFQLEKPLFLINENQIVAEPQQIKINYVNKTITILPKL